MQKLKEVFVLITLAATFAIGCNASTTGVEGNVAFTPDDCGRLGCDFEDSLGVGGLTNVYISGLDGFSTIGVTLASDDTDVLTVTAIGDVAGRPTWELQGVSPGVARLAALDQDGYEVDFIEVSVQELSGLVLENVLGDAVGPAADDIYDERWLVNADQRVVFQVTPVIGEGVPTMGRYTYTPVIEDATFGDHIDAYEALSVGRLDFTVPAGQYGVQFTDGYGHSLSVLFEVQPVDGV